MLLLVDFTDTRFVDEFGVAADLEGDVTKSTPPADLRAEDALVCIHWYVARDRLSVMLVIRPSRSIYGLSIRS
jgi:hypothetical protein